MTTPTITNYFSTKKRRLSPTSHPNAKKLCSSPVKFTQKGMLSPSKYSTNEGTKNQVDEEKKRKFEEMKIKLKSFKEKSEKFYGSRKDDVFTSPVKLRDIPPPAWKRHRNLLETTPSLPKNIPPSPTTPTTLLPLPHKYKTTLELFSATETVTCILNNRGESVMFTKVKQGVLELVRSTQLKECHVAQFLTVLPGCYIVQREKNELVFRFDKKSSLMGSRVKEFKEALLKLCLREHEHFLQKLNITVPPGTRINRWHPKFPLESLPAIPPHPLPEAKSEKPATANEILEKAKGLFCNERVKRAVGAGAIKKEEVKDLKKLKGISEALLEKIRARESKKTLETLTSIHPHQEKQLQLLPKLLPIIRNIFTTESRSSLPYDTIVEKVKHSLNDGSGQAQVEQLIDLLTKRNSAFLKEIQLADGTKWLKIDNKIEIWKVL